MHRLPHGQLASQPTQTLPNRPIPAMESRRRILIQRRSLA